MRDECARYSEYSMDVVPTLFPFGKHGTRQVCMDFLPQTLAVLRIKETRSNAENIARASLSVCVAGRFRFRGELDKAERYELQSINLRRYVLAEHHPDTLTGMSNLWLTHLEQGRFREAEEQAMKVQVNGKMETKTLGEGKTATLQSMSNLAGTLTVQMRWKEAEDLQAKELSACPKLLGKEQPDTLTRTNNLASILSA
ncbi:hypothetical protein LX36DRAFT_730181 [Colletotrichum falcatum]|nr:hypothetical protein LX36DRAFT_730181 [Colletotrichum falcatum]